MLHLIKYTSMAVMMITAFLLTFNDDWRLIVLALVNLVVMVLSDWMISYESREKDDFLL